MHHSRHGSRGTGGTYDIASSAKEIATELVLVLISPDTEHLASRRATR